MPQQTKIFRVFVSSTFTDMREERRILQKEVFPMLEKLCESNGARFQAVDLRWGVNEASQLDHKTIDICLGEIKRCQLLSPKPNFIALLGDRYGWQPIPSKIPAVEMVEIEKSLSADLKNFIRQWYELDENAVPAEYVLKPRDENYRDSEEWKKVEMVIRNTLRNAVKESSLRQDQKIKYFASATHMEIIRGGINPSESPFAPEKHVFVYNRHITNLPQDSSAKDFLDFDGENPDLYCREKLTELKEELKCKFGDHFYDYEAEWQEMGTLKFDFNSFAGRVYNDLKSIMEEQLSDKVFSTELELEKEIHDGFRVRHTEHFSGRHEILDKITSYINSSCSDKPLSIIGESGSGKTSVMAKAVSLTIAGNQNAQIIYRFLGISSVSSNLRSVLLGIIGQIAEKAGETLKSLMADDYDMAMRDMRRLAEIFVLCLNAGTKDCPMIIFLDALDQLSDYQRVESLDWIPDELPPFTKIIVSVLPEQKEYFKDSKELILPSLPENDAIQILNKWFASAGRKISEKQLGILLSNFRLSGSSVYLKLVFEMSKHWHSYDSDILLQSDVNGIINDFFQNLEKEHTEELVKNIVCYMLSGRYEGLSENEILEILFFDKEFKELFVKKTHEEHQKEIETSSRIPIVVWSRLYFDLEPFLAERDADGVSIITFFHRTFITTLRERYQIAYF